MRKKAVNEQDYINTAYKAVILLDKLLWNLFFGGENGTKDESKTIK